MPTRINISFTDESEAKEVLTLLAPILDRFKVKKSNATTTYKHIYIDPKKAEKADK